MNFSYRFRLDGSLWTVGEIKTEHCLTGMFRSHTGKGFNGDDQRLIISRKITMLSMERSNNFAEMTIDEKSLNAYFEAVDEANEHG